MTTKESVPTWKKFRNKSEDAYEARKRAVTRRAWKLSYDLDIPDEKFANFKQNKKLYVQIAQIKDQIDKDILRIILQD